MAKVIKVKTTKWEKKAEKEEDLVKAIKDMFTQREIDDFVAELEEEAGENDK